MEDLDFNFVDEVEPGRCGELSSFTTGLEELSRLDLGQLEDTGGDWAGLQDEYDEFCRRDSSPMRGHPMDFRGTYSGGESSSRENSKVELELRGVLREMRLEEEDWERDSGFEEYLPICQLLANQNSNNREEWFESPYDPEFLAAFGDLQKREKLAKMYLLQVLNPCEDGSTDLAGSGDRDGSFHPRVHRQLEAAINELGIARLAKRSVERISELLITYPNLDLNKYLVDLDVYTVAYLIWGLDFYMCKKCFELAHEGDPSTDGEDSVNEIPILEELYETCRSSYKWLTSKVTSLFSKYFHENA